MGDIINTESVQVFSDVKSEHSNDSYMIEQILQAHKKRAFTADQKRILSEWFMKNLKNPYLNSESKEKLT